MKVTQAYKESNIAGRSEGSSLLLVIVYYYTYSPVVHI